MTVVVLAMSPTGETVYTRDGDGRVWEHHRLVPGSPLLVNESVVDRVVAGFGYERVEISVPSWSEVDDLVRERTSKVQLPDLPVNRFVAHAMLPVIDRWLQSPVDSHRVVPLVVRLLGDAAIAADDDLRREILERVVKAAHAPHGVPRRHGDVVGRRHRVVLEAFPQSFYEAA